MDAASRKPHTTRMLTDALRSSHGPLSLAVLLAACGGASPSPSASAPVSSVSPASAPIASSAGAVASSSASATPSAPSASQPPAASPFVAVAELPYAMRLFALEGGLVGMGTSFVAEDGQASGMPMGIFDGDRFLPKPAMSFPSMWGSVIDVRGAWPAGVDLVAIGTTGRTGIAEHWVLTAEGRWVSRRSRTASLPAGVADVDGSRVTLEFPAMLPGAHKPELRTLRGPKLVRNQAAPSAECTAKMRAEGFPPAFMPSTAVVPEALGATRAGTMLVVGRGACDELPTLESWAPKSTSSTLTKLGLAQDKPWFADAQIVTGSGADEAWILSSQVVHYAGGALRRLPELPTGLALAAAPAGEGSVYVLSSLVDAGTGKQQAPRVYRFDTASAAWQPIDLGGASPDSIVADAQGTVWISAGNTLLRTRRSSDERSVVVAAPATDSAKGQRRPRALPKPASPLCPTNLVVLYGFTKLTPPDYDFPLTRKAIKGHTELAGTRFVVAEDGGQRFFTAIVPSVAIGRKLVALIEREVQGSKPQLLCADPVIVRELRIDLRSGDVLP